ncbi:hypothetical protein J3E68DRAFT_399066 [Trichoderma sp. SZMC 28012]
MSMVFYTRHEDRTGCSSCQVKSCVSAMYKSKRPVKIRSSKVYTSGKLDLLPSSKTQCFICNSNYWRIEEAQYAEHATIIYESEMMVDNVQPYKTLHKDYLRVSPPQSRVSLEPTGFAQDITRYKHVQLLDAKFSTHTIGFLTKIDEEDTSFRFFLGPNYINIEMSLRLFRHLVYKTKPRKRFLKNVSDIIEDNSLFSFNNADIETAKIAIQKELKWLNQNLQMEELRRLEQGLQMQLEELKRLNQNLQMRTEELRRLKQNIQMEELESMDKGLKVRSLYQMKYMMPRLEFGIVFSLSYFYAYIRVR